MTTKTQSTQQDSKERNYRFVKWTIKVLHSPNKTFEEIAKSPNVKGPILILLLVLPLTFGIQYISGSKFFLETPTPPDDRWTEQPPGNLSFAWIPNSTTFDDTDHVVGNFSVSNSVTNSSQLGFRLTGIGDFDFSEEKTHQISFSIKWINGANIISTAKVQLFTSNDESTRFEADIESLLAEAADSWANITLDLKKSDWTEIPKGPLTWKNISGIGFQFTWNEPGNSTVKVDGLFFGEYIPLTASTDFGFQIPFLLVRSSLSYLLEWLILSGIVLLALRSLSEWNGSWKDSMSTVGYVYAAFIVYSSALLILFIVLPPFFLPLNVTTETLDSYQNSWGIPVTAISLLYYAWISVLCTLASRKMGELSWPKAFLIGFGAVILSLLLSSLLLGILL